MRDDRLPAVCQVPRGELPVQLPAEGGDMRVQQMLAPALGLLLVPGVAYAQTPDIQSEVEAKLWVERALAWLQGATRASPLVVVLTLLAVALTLLVSVWLWRSRSDRAS
jgi:hypothetical protein